MLTRKTSWVWIGICCLSGMFLLGQEAWPPAECIDNDGDGYGNPPSANCAYPNRLDCDDNNPDIHPGMTEASYGDILCTDGLDNDCDGLTDIEDEGCQQCAAPEDCDDHNPCTDDACTESTCAYTYNTEPCDTGDPCTVGVCSLGVCAPAGAADDDEDGYGAACGGGNDCNDGNADVYPGAEEMCDGIDNQCPGESGYGTVDEDCYRARPDTGQEACYDNGLEIACPAPGAPFHGQDAHYDIHAMSYMDNGDGTVLDSVTGLVWRQCPAGLSGTNCSTGTASLLNWQDAFDYCSGLGADWRLPLMHELQGIVDYSKPQGGPAIHETFFPGTLPGGYWAMKRPYDAWNDQWIVDFENGSMLEDSPGEMEYVRCVQGKEVPPMFSVQDNGDGTVLDRATGLMWQKCTAGTSGADCESGLSTSISWQDALDYCENDLDGFAGYHDWRLPNVKELAGIKDCYHPEGMDMAGELWTSTSNVNDPLTVWFVGFAQVDAVIKVPRFLQTRCVR